MVREDIYQSIFLFWAGLTNGVNPLFKTATRKLTTWENVDKEDQPALLQLQKSENVTRPRGFPAKWTLSLELFLYVNTGALLDPDVVPSQLLNPLLDAIEAALVIDDIANNACTLGGRVSHCFIDGAVQIFEGNLGDQAVCVIPLTVVVPT